MIQFVLTIVQDEDKDEDVISEIDQIIDDQFDLFIDGIMQDFDNTRYDSFVTWTHKDAEGDEICLD